MEKPVIELSPNSEGLWRWRIASEDGRSLDWSQVVWVDIEKAAVDAKSAYDNLIVTISFHEKIAGDAEPDSEPEATVASPPGH